MGTTREIKPANEAPVMLGVNELEALRLLCRAGKVPDGEAVALLERVVASHRRLLEEHASVAVQSLGDADVHNDLTVRLVELRRDLDRALRLRPRKGETAGAFAARFRGAIVEAVGWDKKADATMRAELGVGLRDLVD